jgi:hypothetical protein
LDGVIIAAPALMASVSWSLARLLIKHFKRKSLKFLFAMLVFVATVFHVK